MHGLMADSGVTIELRQTKYLNNLIEQDHRRSNESCGLCSTSMTSIARAD